jgi:hypothetical protein
MPVEKTCVVCGVKFSVPPVRANSATSCSNKCAVIVRAKSRERKASVTCKGCGNVFLVPRSHKERSRYCSPDCRYHGDIAKQEMSDRVSGNKNPMWRGGAATHSAGYLLDSAPHHPFAVGGYVFQHRLVVEEWLREVDPESSFLVKIGNNLYLAPHAHVHHIDRDVTNNVKENLVVCDNGTHRRIHTNTIREDAHFWPKVEVLLREASNTVGINA